MKPKPGLPSLRLAKLLPVLSRNKKGRIYKLSISGMKETSLHILPTSKQLRE